MKTKNPGCVAYCGSWKSGPIDGLGSKISVGCGGRNATAVHPGGCGFFLEQPWFDAGTEGTSVLSCLDCTAFRSRTTSLLFLLQFLQSMHNMPTRLVSETRSSPQPHITPRYCNIAPAARRVARNSVQADTVDAQYNTIQYSFNKSW